MSDKPPILDAFFIDAIAEILNIGMGSAAASLSKIVNEEILLTIPKVEYVTHQQAAQIISDNSTTDIVGVLQSFKGEFSGDALLMFPEGSSIELVRSFLQQTDIQSDDLKDLAEEAITEIGNIIINSCLCRISNVFGKELIWSVPQYIQNSVDSVFFEDKNTKKAERYVLLLNMNFSIEQKNIQGYMMLIMEVDSISKFKTNVKRFLSI